MSSANATKHVKLNITSTRSVARKYKHHRAALLLQTKHHSHNIFWHKIGARTAERYARYEVPPI